MSDVKTEARRLLSDLASLQTTCLDCGHTSAWEFHQLRSVQERGAHTYGDLVSRGSCAACRAASRRGKNVSWVPKWHKRIRELARS